MRETLSQAQPHKTISPDEARQSKALPPDFGQPAGWMWECDATGKVVFCSPEIEAGLGISAESFTGQGLFTFLLSEQSIAALAFWQENRSYPSEFDIEYTNQDGSPVEARVSFLGERKAEDGDVVILGFTLITAAAIEQAVTPEETKAEGTPQNLVASAVPIIKSLLQYLISHTPAVQKAKNHDIVTHFSQTMEDDLSGEKVKTEMLFGKRIAKYPQIETRRIEQRLEWGEKLDFTPEESKFVEESKCAPSSFRGKLRMQFAADTIQRSKKFWIGVTISSVGDQPAKISIASQDEEIAATIYSTEQLIDEPTILLPVLLQAVKSPNREEEIWVKGKDFLIPA